MKFSDFILMERIIPALQSKSTDEAVKEILRTFKLSPRSFNKNYKLILEREARGTTGMGEGIAIPHTNKSTTKKVVGAFARSEEGVEFNALDGKPVHLIFLVLSSESHGNAHIEVLKYISKQMRNRIYKRFLREAKGKRGIYQLLKEIDQKESS